jgi:hypothetical protein
MRSPRESLVFFAILMAPFGEIGDEFVHHIEIIPYFHKFVK